MHGLLIQPEDFELNHTSLYISPFNGCINKLPLLVHALWDVQDLEFVRQHSTRAKFSTVKFTSGANGHLSKALTILAQ